MIVVTGGAGFIGSCAVARLNAEGYKDILVVDHLVPGDIKKENLKNKKFLDYVDKSDFLDLVLKDKIEDDVEAVVHMGACSSTTLQDAAYFRSNNFEYSCHLALWALKKEARFIYASSAATYGDGERGYADDEKSIPLLKPLNLYGESKQNFDLWVLERRFQDRMVGLKFFNVFGPNEYHKGDMRSVILKAYDRVVGDGTMTLFKSHRPDFRDGEQKRDFIYVKDAVDVVMFFFSTPSVNGIFNVGTGQARSWNDLARALFSAVGRPPHIEYVEMPDILRSRYQYFTQADMSKLRASGYTRPFTTLEKSVEDYVSYLKVLGHM